MLEDPELVHTRQAKDYLSSHFSGMLLMMTAHARFSTIVLIRTLLAVAGAIAGLAIASGTVAAQVNSDRVVEEFENTYDAGPPLSWQLITDTQYAIEVVTGEACEGQQSAQLRSLGTPQLPEFGNFAHDRINAQSFRGMRIRYQACVKTSRLSDGSGAGLWLRIDREDGSIAFLQNMQDNKIDSSEWQRFDVAADVPLDADSLRFGLILYGGGEAWIDAVRLEVVGTLAPSAVGEPPDPLTADEIERLMAFARFYGYVRYFHPSDGAAVADWDSLAISGVRRVLRESGPASLAETLQEIFVSIAPSVGVWQVGIDEEPSPFTVVRSYPGLRRLQWVHRGIFHSEPALYRPYSSDRIATNVEADARLGGATDPAWPPLRVELGVNLAAWVPTILYADSAGTLPRDRSHAAHASVPAAHQPTNSSLDRSTRLANVIIAWNVFQHFYPYFDVVNADWESELARALRIAATNETECEHLAVLRQMVAALQDGHGAVSHLCDSGLYYPPVRVALVEGHPTVTSVNGPDVGLQLGDRILTIDGEVAEQRVEERMATISTATRQWGYHRVLGDLLSGRRGTEVRIEAERVSGDTVDLVLVRSHANSGDAARPPSVSELQPGIWYVDLDRVSDDDWVAVLPELVEASGLIFDMRGYPRRIGQGFLGNLTLEPLQSPQWHIPLVTSPEREMVFERSGWTIEPRTPYLSAEKAFLIDGSAISAAETLMGIVEFYQLGEIVGEPTAGTNGNINPFRLPGGYTVRWTGMKVLKHDGSQHHGVGIRPSVPVSRTRRGVAAGVDEALETAISILQ